VSEDSQSAPLVLGLDTATTVAVGLGRGAEVLATAEVGDRMAHVERLIGLVSAVTREAGVPLSAVGLIVVGLGPGPFTGLRVGIATAQILSHTLGIGLRGMCTLDVLAAQQLAQRPLPGDFLVATDARRREVYWARYGRDGRRQAGPEVNRPADLPDLPVVGPGAELSVTPHPVSEGGIRGLAPAFLVTAGPALPDLGRRPLYLRRPDAAEPGRRKSVLTSRRAP
jgi:tRNA threonylcarbamoyl adenosine modification protein YeaZ